jgi:hypothetical protein
VSLKINSAAIADKDKHLVDELIRLAKQEFDISVKKVVVEAQLALRTLKPGESKTFRPGPFEVTIENTSEPEPEKVT